MGCAAERVHDALDLHAAHRDVVRRPGEGGSRGGRDDGHLLRLLHRLHRRGHDLRHLRRVEAAALALAAGAAAAAAADLLRALALRLLLLRRLLELLLLGDLELRAVGEVLRFGRVQVVERRPHQVVPDVQAALLVAPPPQLLLAALVACLSARALRRVEEDAARHDESEVPPERPGREWRALRKRWLRDNI
eukprot:534243-Alexandrium_andersonii.AAC.1